MVKTPTSGSTALPRERLVCVGVVSDNEMFFVRSEKEGELSLSSSTVIDRLTVKWLGGRRRWMYKTINKQTINMGVVWGKGECRGG